jgi:RHH-type rel operon transcriptional repressor/antitoxin RelB
MPTGIYTRLSDDVAQRLAGLAARTGRSKTYYVTQAINRHLEDLEDLYDAEQALIEFKASGAKAIPLTSIMKRYDLGN